MALLKKKKSEGTLSHPCAKIVLLDYSLFLHVFQASKVEFKLIGFLLLSFL